jgi:hypothetical protein
MFLETRNAYGLVFIDSDSIVTITPASVRESKSDSTSLTQGACVTVVGGEEYYVLDTPLDLIESIKLFD